MKRLGALLLALVLWPTIALAQPVSSIVVNQTPIHGGTNGLCLYQTSTGRVGEQVCGTGTAANIQVGTTTVGGGTSGYLLYNNAGVLGNLNSLSAFFATSTGATTARTLAAHFADLLNVKDFGAVCDGATDDTTALNAAVASGKHISGLGTTGYCAYTGNLTLLNGSWLQDIGIKQLSPSSATRRTLTISGGVGPITLIRVKVDRNGAKTDGSVADAAGIYLAGTNAGAQIEGVYLEDVEVFGNGKGNGIVITDAIAPQIVRSYVHDMGWQDTTDPCTEQINGGRIIRSTNVYLDHPRVSNLTGRLTVGTGGCANNPTFSANTDQYYQTDGWNFSSVTGATVVGAVISGVGEGIDVSGSGINRNVWFYGNTYLDTGAYGEKWCHDPYDGGSVGSRSYRSGIAGLAFCGDAPDVIGPKNIRITSFSAIDVGSATIWPSLSQIGIVFNGTIGSNNVCIGCQAVDGTSSMEIGARNEPASAAVFRLQDFYTSGATSSDYAGFTNGVTSLVTAGAQAINGNLTVANVGATTRITTLASGGGGTFRFDNNAATTTITMQNFGITAINQGSKLTSQLGAASPGVTAGQLYWNTTGDFSIGANQSVTFTVDCMQGGAAITNCLSASTTAASVPGTFTATSFIGSGATLTSIPLSGLATQATNTVVGNATAGTASPTALAVGSCSSASSALIWTTNTGFGCNTSINAATLGSATFAAPGTIGGGTPGLGTFTTVTATTSFSANGTPGLSVTKSVRKGDDSGACDLVFTLGLLTSSTC